MSSPLRGWLQQLLDQYSGQSRFPGERCWIKRSPAALKINSENARCRTPFPSWHLDLLSRPTTRSAASTRISASTTSSTVIALDPHRAMIANGHLKQAALAEPTHGIIEGLGRRPPPVPQLANRFGAREKHVFARHAHAFERDPAAAARDPGYGFRQVGDRQDGS